MIKVSPLSKHPRPAAIVSLGLENGLRLRATVIIIARLRDMIGSPIRENRCYEKYSCQKNPYHADSPFTAREGVKFCLYRTEFNFREPLGFRVVFWEATFVGTDAATFPLQCPN